MVPTRVYVMFDFDQDRLIDQSELSNALNSMTDAELEQLEDELNFAIFAGLPSPRILALLNDMIDLDSAWKAQLDRQVAQAA